MKLSYFHVSKFFVPLLLSRQMHQNKKFQSYQAGGSLVLPALSHVFLTSVYRRAYLAALHHTRDSSCEITTFFFLPIRNLRNIGLYYSVDGHISILQGATSNMDVHGVHLLGQSLQLLVGIRHRKVARMLFEKNLQVIKF